MRIKIFDIHESQVVINENCLLIPELRVLHESYENPIPVFCFVHYMTDPLGPYGNIAADLREEILFEDYPGDYTLEDEALYNAIRKLHKLYETPTMRLKNNAEKGLETLSTYLGSAVIRDDDKGGNLNAFNTALSKIGKISQEFRTLEKQVEDEMRVRGDKNLGYDEL